MLPTSTLRPTRQALAARAVLGPGHPLAVVEERIRSLLRQEVVVAALVIGSVGALIAGATELLVVAVAATAVQAAVCLGLVAAVGARRRQALELIAAGRTALPVISVERERERLVRRVGALAASIDRIRAEARRPRRSIVAPLYVPSIIRELDDELARTASLLRCDHPDLAAVARTEALLGSAVSPLYGTDVRRLREELRRLQFALSTRAAS